MTEPNAGTADYTGLTACICEHGWPRGLEALAQQSFEQGYHISTDLWPRHAAWKGLLSYTHRRSALVIESGCGTVALSLARDFDHVHVVPAGPEVLEGIRARLRYLAVPNVTVLEALERGEARYDAAAICGVDAEYLCRHLTAITASLRRHGSLYIALDSTRERPVCRVLSPLLRRVLRRLRRQFPRVNSYCYSGSLTQPSELRGIGWHQKRWKHRVSGLLAPYIGRTFGIVAATAEAGPSLFEEILAASGSNLQVERRLFAHPAGFSLIARDPDTGQRSIIRIPSDDHSFQRARNNYTNVNLLQELGAAPVAVPRQVRGGQVRGQSFFVEQMLEGRNLHRTELRDESLYAAVTAGATRCLIDLHRATAQAGNFTPARVQTIAGEIVQHARRALAGDTGRHVLPDVEAYLLSALASRPLKQVFFHGDYTYDNLMFDASGRRVTGMFDWDLSRPDGLPLLDLLYFLVTAERGHTGGWVPDIFANRIKHGFNAIERKAIHTYCHALDLSPEIVTPLFILTCLHHLAIRMHSPERYSFFRDYWTDFLEALPGIIFRGREAGVL
jgi:aminoglycoside phosphotransferase (APT) family kinase protein